MNPVEPTLSPAAAAPILRTENLSVGYRAARSADRGGDRRVLSGLDLDLHPGELVCLLGPNGAGKSTLLRTLAGLQAPLEGRLLLDGRDASTLSAEAWARRTAIVLTERIEAGNLSVFALAALGRHPHTGWSGRMSEADRTAVRRGLEDAGAWDLRHRVFDELSDGEKQRVMLARALAQEPALLLLDEPTAFLDLPRRVETMRILRVLARERGRAILLSTHDLDLALRAADRIWLVPPGGPVRTGLPEDLALAGAFGSVFDQGDVAFDLATGQFRIHGHPLRTAALSGDAVLVFWTARALERLGYASAGIGDTGMEGRGNVRVTATRRNGIPEWECRLPEAGDGHPESFPSLETLSARLRRRDP
ncbi:MAG: transporter related [Fibrobacteres bacterium]|nr:transporter related [Fibrobacterota bacterium]